MAKIVTDTITIKINRLVKNGYAFTALDFTEDFTEGLEGVVAELLGLDNAVIEVVVGDKDGEF